MYGLSLIKKHLSGLIRITDTRPTLKYNESMSLEIPKFKFIDI